MDEAPIASSSTSPNSILPILLTLPTSHSAHVELLKSHRPFSHPSHLDAGGATKYLNRLHSSIVSRDDLVARRAGCELAKAVIEQDEEGWVLNGWGKGWIGACLGAISAHNVVLGIVVPPIQLLQAIILEAKGYPGFERDAVTPVLGKLSITLTRLLDQCSSAPEGPYDILFDLLTSTRSLLLHSPAPFRPSVPSIRSLLHNIILHAPTPPSIEQIPSPAPVRQAAADLLAALHLAAGKASSSAVWSADIKDALGGLGACLGAITQDGFMEEPPRIPPPSTTSLPPLPSDPAARLPLALEFMEGFVEIILAYLRFPASRPVAVPLAGLVSASLRCLNLTLGTPMVNYISPTHHAALLALPPRLWTAGLLLLAGTGAAVGDNIFPHMSDILDHAVFLAETIPTSMLQSHVGLLRFFQLWLDLYPAAILPSEYTTRLVKMCLGRLAPLLEKRPSPGVIESGGGGGKKGKKRARGMGVEDGLVAGLEGRSSDAIGEDVEIALEALRLITLLHQAPLLPPALLTFSIRLHLSIYLNLDGLNGRFVQRAMEQSVRDAVKHVLEDAVLLSEEEGTQRGWKSVIIGVLEGTRAKFNLLLHPSLPPLPQPAPPLASLHFFAPETEEEKRLRLELGFAMPSDTLVDGTSESEPEYAHKHSHWASRRRSDASAAHVTHHAAQVVPSATLTAPPEAQVPHKPIIIDPGPSAPDPGSSSAPSAADITIGAAEVVPSSISPDTQRTIPLSIPTERSVTGSVEAHTSESIPTTSSVPPVTVVDYGRAQEARPVPITEEEDEGIPELDSGSSDEDGMDEDDEADEDDGQGE